MKLIFGDCIEKMKDIPNESVDLILTDPPYGSTRCKWDSVIPFDIMWKSLNRIIKKNGVILLFGVEPFSSHLRMSNLKNFKYDWIWDKVTARGHLNAKFRPMMQTEIISVFGGNIYYPQMIQRPKDKIAFRKRTEYNRTTIMATRVIDNSPKNKLYDKWFPKNIIKVSNASSSIKSIHPTQKPVELLEYLIKTYSLEGETVLDFTMGSGSTGEACINLNRNFIGIENDEKYFNLATKRLEKCVKLKNNLNEFIN